MGERVTETVPSTAPAIAGCATPGLPVRGGGGPAATARRTRSGGAAQGEAGAAARWPHPALNAEGSRRLPGARQVRRSPWRCGLRARTSAAVGMEAAPARPGAAADWPVQQTRGGGVISPERPGSRRWEPGAPTGICRHLRALPPRPLRRPLSPSPRVRLQLLETRLKI